MKMLKNVGIALVITLIPFVLLYAYIINSPYKVQFIMSGSMEPVIPTNSIIITDTSIPYEEIKTGDIITFTREAEDGEVLNYFSVTHRAKNDVVTVNEEGKRVVNPINTKGDANPMNDTFGATEDNYIGKYIGNYACVKWLVDGVCEGPMREVSQGIRTLCVCLVFLFHFVVVYIPVLLIVNKVKKGKRKANLKG